MLFLAAWKKLYLEAFILCFASKSVTITFNTHQTCWRVCLMSSQCRLHSFKCLLESSTGPFHLFQKFANFKVPYDIYGVLNDGVTSSVIIFILFYYPSGKTKARDGNTQMVIASFLPPFVMSRPSPPAHLTSPSSLNILPVFLCHAKKLSTRACDDAREKL